MQSALHCDLERLGVLAANYRFTHDPLKRERIAKDYGDIMRAVIRTYGESWDEMPAAEDQLPDEHMPKEWFDFLASA